MYKLVMFHHIHLFYTMILKSLARYNKELKGKPFYSGFIFDARKVTNSMLPSITLPTRQRQSVGMQQIQKSIIDLEGVNISPIVSMK